MVLVVKNLLANARDARDPGSIPGLGRSSGVENGNLFQYSCLGNPMDRGAWWATIHGGHQQVRHDLATKQLQQQTPLNLTTFNKFFYLGGKYHKPNKNKDN